MGRRDKHLKKIREREQRQMTIDAIISSGIPINPQTADVLGINYPKANDAQKASIANRLRSLHSGEGARDRAEPSDGSDTC